MCLQQLELRKQLKTLDLISIYVEYSVYLYIRKNYLPYINLNLLIILISYFMGRFCYHLYRGVEFEYIIYKPISMESKVNNGIHDYKLAFVPFLSPRSKKSPVSLRL